MTDRPKAPLPTTPATPAAAPRRAPYVPPALEALGRWSALTLQQSVPIGPGGFLIEPERIGRLA